jgi:hypothetical protein
MQKKRLTLMTITVIGVMLSAFIMGQALAKGPKPEIGAKQITTQINGQRAWQFDRKLCSDEMAGRLAGTEGGALAAEYISKKFKEWGLEPAGDDGTYYQGFTSSRFGMLFHRSTWNWWVARLIITAMIT